MKSLAMILALSGASVQAQVVTPCAFEGDTAYLASIGVVAEPWEENTRLFADGAVRLVVMDTEEPAFAAYHLALLIWGEDEIGIVGRSCFLVSLGRVGFYDATLAGMASRYDPAFGLVLTVPVSLYDAEQDRAVVTPLEVLVNQRSSSVQARFLP